MDDSRFIVIRAQFERQPKHGRALAWIAPELKDAGLKMLEDRTGDVRPARTWAGIVDASTFERFARAWRLRDETAERSSCTPAQDGHHPARSYAFDGMNWESGGESPIVYVSLHVFPIRAEDHHLSPVRGGWFKPHGPEEPSMSRERRGNAAPADAHTQ